MTTPKTLNLAIMMILASIATIGFADENKPNVDLPAMQIGISQSQTLFGDKKASDTTVYRTALQQRSATLGNALAGELGVHSNPFGGGASKPIIRGQEGVRVKILQNGSDVVDMSALSPDHAVAVDTLLANRVELVRGASTLLYGTASPAGVVNVIDERIPTAMPQGSLTDKISGDTLLRYNSASREKVATAGLTFGIGSHLAVRLEGLKRDADNYKVPSFASDVMLDYLPDSHNKSTVGTAGISWIGSKGYVGASYSHRKDKYGITGHNHSYDKCISHVLTPEASVYHYYLKAYPHLMQDVDFSSSAHFHCGTDLHHDHNHDHPFGFAHDHNHPGPWIDMMSKRYDVKAQWLKPIKGLDKVQLSLTSADYYHEENDHEIQKIDPATKRLVTINNKPGYFSNQGKNARLELYHTPFYRLQGVWGLQWQKQTSFAHLPHEREQGQRFPLVTNTNKQFSIFGVERWRMNDKFALELGGRMEKQKIPISYDENELARYRPKPECWDWFGRVTCSSVVPAFEEPDLSTYREKALSYSASAIWDFKPNHRLSATYSHNERLPTPMELYYHGKHLATNSFEFGNIGLNKEKSDNLELGLKFNGDKWSYALSAYHSRFKNYIYNENVYREGNLFMRRHKQAQADFYGLEGMLSYRNHGHEVSVFGDVVRGKLKNLPNAYAKAYRCNGEYTTTKPEDTYENMWACDYNYYADDFNYSYQPLLEQPNMTTPRLPPARLGVRWQGELANNWTADAEYTKVFAQNRTSKLESPTAGYNMLNVGVGYHNTLGGVEYDVSLRANNLLNEQTYIHNSFLPYVPQMGRNYSVALTTKF